MKPIALVLCLGLATPTPAVAQDLPKQAGDAISRLLGLLLPDQAEILRRLGTPDQYEAPEILPNGDILIRRKPQPLPPPKDGEIDL